MESDMPLLPIALLLLTLLSSPVRAEVICNPSSKVANTRPGPSAEQFPTIVETLQNGTAVRVLERVANVKAGRDWLKIEFKSRKSGGTLTAFVDSAAVAARCDANTATQKPTAPKAAAVPVQAAAPAVGPSLKAAVAPASSTVAAVAQSQQPPALVPLGGETTPGRCASNVSAPTRKKLEELPATWGIDVPNNIGEQNTAIVELAFSAGDKLVVARHKQSFVTVWDAIRAQAKHELILPDGDTRSMFVVGDRVTTFRPYEKGRAWDLGTGKVLKEWPDTEGIIGFQNPHANAATSTFAALTSTQIQVRRLDDGEPVGSVFLPLRQGGGRAFFDLAFSPDGRRVAAVANDGFVLWNVGHSKFEIEKFGIQSNPGSRAPAVRFSGDGRYLVVSVGLDWVDIFDVASGALARRVETGGAMVFNVEISPDASRLAITTADNVGRIWDVKSGRLLATYSGKVHWGISFAKNGCWVVVRQLLSTEMWSGSDNRYVGSIGSDAVFSHDGDRAVMAEEASAGFNRIVMYDLNESARLRDFKDTAAGCAGPQTSQDEVSSCLDRRQRELMGHSCDVVKMYDELLGADPKHQSRHQFCVAVSRREDAPPPTWNIAR